MLLFALCLSAAVMATAIAVRGTRRDPNVTSYRSIVEGIDAIAFEYAPLLDELRYLSPQARSMLGVGARELMRDAIHPDDRERVRGAVRAYGNGEATGRIDYRLLREDGGVVYVRTLLGEREAGVIRGVTIDTTKQTRLESERREAQQVASLGRLAAGVAHEINTPTQFTADSLQFVREAIAELGKAIERHPEARAVLAADEHADLEYLIEHVPLALDRARNGLDRIATIAKSLRELAMPESEVPTRTTVDVHEALGDSLSATRAEYATICEITTDLAELPHVHGNRGELRRVFAHLLRNAARSIGDTARRGTIAISSRMDGSDHVVVRVADTGTGIPVEVRHLIFDPFFTTRDVGTARGQGLAVSRATIARHGGTLGFETELGKGTTFTIRLPIAAATTTSRRAGFLAAGAIAA